MFHFPPSNTTPIPPQCPDLYKIMMEVTQQPKMDLFTTYLKKRTNKSGTPSPEYIPDNFNA